jgi:chitinase
MTKLLFCVVALFGCTAVLDGDGTGGDDTGGGDGSGSGSGGGGTAPAGLIFSAYKDTSINMDWNTNIISTMVPGTRTPLVDDMVAHGAKTITLSFATGECGSENWGGVPGAAMATANVPKLTAANVKYILATGGAAGSFTCATDAGMMAFLARWDSPNLVGVDYDIEAGQSEEAIGQLIERIIAAHAAYPKLRWSLTLATLANNDGSPTAVSLGASAPSSFNIKGDQTLAAVKSRLGFNGSEATWPSYVTVNLMTMDYGGPSPGVCVVSGGLCDMGQSAIQAAYNLHDHWGVPWSNIELTPMIGGNDVQDEHFTLQDTDEMTAFAIQHELAGVHYWSYDRDVDCPAGSASPTCNSLGGVGPHGFLASFIAAGMN